MRKVLVLIVAAAAVMMVSSCRSSRPACPAYTIVKTVAPSVHF